MMDTRLITFLELVRTKSYTKTAQALYITQPAVTHHIKSLEKDNNIKLFANTKTFRLSVAGQIIYEYAQKCELMDNQLKQALEKEASSTHTLKFAVTNQVSSVLMNKILIKWMKNHPMDQIIMNILNQDEIIDAIHSGNIDFAIIDSNYDQTLFNGKNLFSLSASICVGATHSLSRKQKINSEQLQNETLITNLESGTNDLLDIALKNDNLCIQTLPNILRINDPKTVKDLVINGIGLALIYDDYIMDELKEKKLYTLNFEGNKFSQDINIIWSNDSLIEKQIINVANEIKAIYSEEK